MRPIDLEPQENGTPWPKDGREAVGGYPHLPLTDRPKFEPPDTSYAHPWHTSCALHHTTQKTGPGAEEHVRGHKACCTFNPQAADRFPLECAADRLAVFPTRPDHGADHIVPARWDRGAHGGQIDGRLAPNLGSRLTAGRARCDVRGDSERPQAQHGKLPNQPHLGSPSLLWFEPRRPVRRALSPAEACRKPLRPIDLRRQLLAHALAEPWRSVPFKPVGGDEQPRNQHPGFPAWLTPARSTRMRRWQKPCTPT
jgi:hypothetical protein